MLKMVNKDSEVKREYRVLVKRGVCYVFLLPV